MVKEFFVAACAMLALAAAPAVKDADEEQEREITLEEVPEAARSAILNEAGENPVSEVDEVVIGEETYFEAEWIVEGREVEIRVTAEGTIVGREIEDEDGDDDDEERNHDARSEGAADEKSDG
jgi:hypothetical protein